MSTRKHFPCQGKGFTVGVGYTGLFFANFTRSSSPQFLFLSFDANDLKIGKNMNFAKNSGFAWHKTGQND